MAYRACAAADRTGHAILHTLYQQCLKHQARFFIEYFALDLLMDDDGACRGLLAWCLEDGSIHRFSANMVVIATGGCGRVYQSCTSAHTCTGDGSAMVLRAGLPLQDMEFIQFHPTGVYGAGVSDYRGRARRRRLSDQQRGRAVHAQICAARKGFVLARCREPGRSCRDPGRPRGRREEGPHSFASRASARGCSRCATARHRQSARTFAGVDAHKEPIPVIPTVHYVMGGIPTNINAEVVSPKKTIPRQLCRD